MIYALLKSFPDLILMFLLFRAVFSKKGIDKSVCIRSFIYPSDGSSWGLMMLRSQNLLVSLNANNPALEFISQPVYPLFNIVTCCAVVFYKEFEGTGHPASKRNLFFGIFIRFFFGL